MGTFLLYCSYPLLSRYRLSMRFSNSIRLVKNRKNALQTGDTSVRMADVTLPEQWSSTAHERDRPVQTMISPR